MAKIALIGAGSVVFAKNLIGDILSFPELADCHIALMDIDADRLRVAERMTHKVAAALNARRPSRRIPTAAPRSRTPTTSSTRSRWAAIARRR